MFQGVELSWNSRGLDVAEGAASRARVSHEHEGRGAGAPALPDVRAERLLADGREALLLRVLLDGLDSSVMPILDSNPLRLDEIPHAEKSGGRLYKGCEDFRKSSGKKPYIPKFNPHSHGRTDRRHQHRQGRGWRRGQRRMQGAGSRLRSE